MIPMKMKTLAIASCCSLLVACSGGGENSSGTGVVGSIPTGVQRYNMPLSTGAPPLAGNNTVASMSYDPASQTLTIAGDPFDLAGVFRRVASRDVAGFAAFENTGGARRYLALVRTDEENGLAVGVVGTPFRLDTEFGGTMYARAETPTLPTNREVTHVGTYAAVRNVGSNVGANESNSHLHRVTGVVRLDLDFFTDRPTGGIEGVITNRRSLDEWVLVNGRRQYIRYDDIVLVFTNIDSDGSFYGVANVLGGQVGRYEGLIAGDNAAASAGNVIILESGQLERGAFMARTQ
jgi:hypothetical protein